MRTYNKLVRDRIPEIIEQDGGRPTTRRLEDHEYILALQAKLVEEWGEFVATPSIEEFADVVEVEGRGLRIAVLLGANRWGGRSWKSSPVSFRNGWAPGDGDESE